MQLATQSLEQMMRDLSVAYHLCEERRRLRLDDDNVLDDLEWAFNARAREFQNAVIKAGGSPKAIMEATHA